MTDPFTALSSPHEPVDPGDEVRARIRARVEERLRGADQASAAEAAASEAAATEDAAAPSTSTSPSTSPTGTTAGGTTMSDTTQQATVTGLSPYLVVRGAREAIRFYEEVFGAVPVGDVFVGDDGRVGHAELRFGDFTVMLADEHPEHDAVGPASLGGTSVGLQVQVPDAAITAGRAQVRGATIIREVSEQFYGAVAGVFLDPWGHRWTVTTPLARPVDRDEVAANSEDMGYHLEDTGTPRSGGGRSRNGELVYLTLPTADLERGMAFFGELMGWEFSEPGSQGGVHILNANFPGSVGPSGGTAPKVSFVVDDLDAAVATVRRLGGTASDPEGPDAWRTSACTDGAGLEFTLVQAAPGPYPVGNEL